MSGVIQANAKQLKELYARIGESVKHRSDSPEGNDAWHQTCSQFHREYDRLAFPGGYSVGVEKIKAGDLATIETALEYLENTPYCFRSQYVATTLSRALNKAPLSERNKERLMLWKKAKRDRRFKGYAQQDVKLP